METLTDNSPFPFGQHKGKAMINVPAQYLLWCLEQDWFKSWEAVELYILDNKEVIEQQAKKEKAEFFKRQNFYRK